MLEHNNILEICSLWCRYVFRLVILILIFLASKRVFEIIQYSEIYNKDGSLSSVLTEVSDMEIGAE
jgi:hypothetical protein